MAPLSSPIAALLSLAAAALLLPACSGYVVAPFGARPARRAAAAVGGVAWAKGLKQHQQQRLSSLTWLQGKRDLVDELSDDGEPSEGGEGGGSAAVAKKEKVKLEPEVTYFEGPPDISETFVPAVSILTVIGIIPFAAAVARQAWVRYTVTSRRIRIVSGINGKDETEIVYPDIKRMLYIFRFFGRCGDVVMELRDGSKLEMRSLPNFEENYNYMLARCSEECQAASQKIKPQA